MISSILYFVKIFVYLVSMSQKDGLDDRVFF